ncbi:MAG: DeoR/GlpR transcriptional regulator, partial [Spirochaetales bacterium]|nr:DeoR/GlpR transcriptional regulator [Spirochaetales bacterium]
HADKAFVSCTSVDLDKGLTDTNEEEARIRRVMLDRAVRKILIADTTKFGKVSFASICPLKDIDTVVSDSSLGGEWSVRFQEMGIEHFYKNS